MDVNPTPILDEEYIEYGVQLVGSKFVSKSFTGTDYGLAVAIAARLERSGKDKFEIKERRVRTFVSEWVDQTTELSEEEQFSAIKKKKAHN